MRRRTVLATLAALPAAGCTAPGEPTTGETGVDSPETPAETPDPADPILFVIDNDTDGERTVTLRLTRTDRTVLDETVTLAPGERREYDSGIRSPGEYDLSVRVTDGPERTMPLSIEAFDVRNGSNHFVDITADGIRVYWEE